MTARVAGTRLLGFALLATLGALQWVRYVEGASDARAVAWAAAGTVTGALILLARGRAVALVAAVAAGAALAIAASGLDLTFLEPRHLDELGGGLGRGVTALNTVRLPYLGKEPWVLTTVQLSGAGICWLAAVLAAWPGGRGPRMGALLLLLVMVAAPTVSIGATRPALLGLALAVLTAAFLFGERLAGRPGLGAVALAVAVLAAAVPLGAAADREQPWFDYKAFSDSISGGVAVSYSWNHDYGPIDWPREGVELFRVKSDRPFYWKADVLNRFAEDRWQDGSGGDAGSEVATPRRAAWTAEFSVALRRLRTETVVGAGSVLSVTDASRPVEPDYIAGLWSVKGTKELSKGDSYRVRAYVPRPTPDQLAAATVGDDPQRAGSLQLQVGIRPEAEDRTPYIVSGLSNTRIHPDTATISFAPYESDAPPRADFEQLGLTDSGRRTLRLSTYARTWRLASRLRRASSSPYDYVLRIDDYLRGDGFTYTEVPDPPAPGVPPLESFLLDSKGGYCQQFSGAMALLLRMGGVPARVATGFSPGGLRGSSREWVVRDTDAHSWVEAWFDGIGWVTFDPTPPATPARSQIARLGDRADADGGTANSTQGQSRLRNRRPEGAQRDAPSAASRAGSGSGDGSPWPWLALGGVLAAAVAGGAIVATRRGRGDALAELERALRRSGRTVPAGGVTLTELERRLGASAYLRALRASRYRPGAPGPTPADRAAFRRELASGLGWMGKLRGYWALPPRFSSRSGPR